MSNPNDPRSLPVELAPREGRDFEREPHYVASTHGRVPPRYAPSPDDRDAGYLGGVFSGASTDYWSRMRGIATLLFPEEKLDKALARMTESDGVIYYGGDDGRLYRAFRSRSSASPPQSVRGFRSSPWARLTL